MFITPSPLPEVGARHREVKKISEENYWSDCERMTGAAKGKSGVKTAKEIGVAGAWTLKARGKAKILVGCLRKSESEWADMSILSEKKDRVAEHVTVCEHGVVVGASSRRVAIMRAKVSDQWCEKCAARVAAL